jgi:hypothetical protein
MIPPLTVGFVSGLTVGFVVVGRGVLVVTCVGRVVTVLVVTGVCWVTAVFVCSGEGAVLTFELPGLLVVTTSEFEVFPVFAFACSGVGVGVGDAGVSGVGVATFVMFEVPC